MTRDPLLPVRLVDGVWISAEPAFATPITASDVGGEPDASACAPLLEPCAGVGCACVAAGALSCEEDVGAVTAHYPGG